MSIEELVPNDHLLRKIDKAMDFGFIREKVRSLYCADNGRPAIDPVVLFKMLFIGYLFGVRSERQLRLRQQFWSPMELYVGLTRIMVPFIAINNLFVFKRVIIQKTRKPSLKRLGLSMIWHHRCLWCFIEEL